MVPNGTIFDNSLEKGKPYDVRVGAGQVCLLQKLNHGNLSAAAAGVVHLAQECFMSTVVQISAAISERKLQRRCFNRLPGSLSDADLIVLFVSDADLMVLCLMLMLLTLCSSFHTLTIPCSKV